MDKYVGKRLDGRYEIKEVIGVGGMAYVYKAYDCIDDRTVAVKILKDEYLANEEFTRRFKNESKAIAILSHPNIVKVYDVSFGERLQYIVMEYIDGITLKEYIEQQQDIKWKEAVHFTVQILRALQHAHDKGIVHRDIKPQNIMLLPDGTIKVTDFGIARFSRNEIRATGAGDKAIGSVHYISPEQARGDITDEKADIYSTGVMLYEMLTGRLPFEADNAVSVAIMQLQSEPKRPREINPEIPEGLEEITLKAMQKDPAKRYQSAAEMLNDIDEFKRNPSIHFEYTYFEDKTPTRFVEAITRVKGEAPITETEPEADAEEEEEEEEKKGPPVLPILAAIAGAFVVVGLIFVLIIFINSLNPEGKDELVVENFIGMNYNEDIANNSEYTSKYNFKYNTEYSDAPQGEVIDQDIEPGETRKVKCEITLTLSAGQKLIQIPEVRPGDLKETVIAHLKQAGFQVLEVQTSSEDVPEGAVISTDPSYPAERPENEIIKVLISTGIKEPDPIPVPNVMNLALQDAIDKLMQNGFAVNSSNVVRVNNSAPEGTVIAQSPEAESSQKPGTEVVLTVSSGYRDVDVSVPLPNTSTPVDLQIYINGKINNELSNSYKGLLPSALRSITIKCTEQAASYDLTIMISPANENQFTTYVSYTVNGRAGSASMNGSPSWTEPTSATTAPPTTPSTMPPTTTPTSSETSTTESTVPTSEEEPAEE